MIRHALLPLLSVLLVGFTTGCPLIGVVADSIASAAADDPPRVTASWARDARQMISPSTPTEDELTAIAEYGPEDDRDTNEFCDLSEDEGLVQVHVKMGEGTYYLHDQVILKDADVVIEGEGSHKTVLYLWTEELRSIYIKRAKSVVIKNLTVIAYSGGGTFIKGCDDVKIQDAVFAGTDRALAMRGCKATIERTVFDGNANGIVLDGSDAVVRECAFKRCYEGISGEGKLELSSSLLVDNRTAISAKLSRGSSIRSNVFYGEKQEAGWSGRPRTVTANLTHRRDLGEKFPERINYRIKDVGNFPDGVRLPPGFDVVGVHFAAVREESRTSKDPATNLDDVAFDGATRYASAATKAARGGDIPSAREAIRVAMRYWGDRPMADAPDQLIALAGLELDDDKPIK